MSFPSELEPINVPDFAEAIAYAEKLLSYSDRLSEAELEQLLTNLLQTTNGARGFFVCYLPGDWQLADHPNQAIVKAIQACADSTAELMVKNLAMSTAMAIAHHRQGNDDQAKGSEQVAQRSLNLIKLLSLPEIAQIADRMYESVTTGGGEHGDFLQKWGYDQEQKAAIAARLNMVK
jgi:VCBS repeat-containing protein